MLITILVEKQNTDVYLLLRELIRSIQPPHNEQKYPN